MTGRGQHSFETFPAFAAHLYDRLTHTRAIAVQTSEIAADLMAHIQRGRLLDVGCGPGNLLHELRLRNPALELYGLDISASMVVLAQGRLANQDIHVSTGTIEHAPFEDGFFDLVTCTGSFYLWDHPRECIDEIFRILAPRASAYLYETCRDCDRRDVRRVFRSNLRGEGLLRRLLAPRLFLKQLDMTYSTEEIKEILERTRFAQSFAIQRIGLAGMPAWARISLTKDGGLASVPRDATSPARAMH